MGALFLPQGLDQFDFDFQPSIDERKVRELAGLASLERKENEAIVAGYSVYFVTVQDLVAQFQRARDENKLKERDPADQAQAAHPR